MKKEDADKEKLSSAVFKVGAIALAFLMVGYQTALFVTRASRLRLEANRDRPDTVYVYSAAPEENAGPEVGLQTRATLGIVRGGTASGAQRWGPKDGLQSKLPDGAGGAVVRRNAPHTPYVESYRQATRRVESFRFNPNTVSVEDLIRLGFSEKQAAAIERYRASGGRFRRKADFAKSFVVADSVYRRLERFIDIPRVDLNRADSAALDDLPGIGPWYAKRILEYRAELGGYSFPEQLLDIYHFDREKFDALSDLIFCSPPEPFALWSLPADSLRLHPYIRTRQVARSIVLFRDHTPREGWTVAALGEAGILPPEDAARLARCTLAPP
jgi:DNA uptake protein ComE-like DNA-binding protein